MFIDPRKTFRNDLIGRLLERLVGGRARLKADFNQAWFRLIISLSISLYFLGIYFFHKTDHIFLLLASIAISYAIVSSLLVVWVKWRPRAYLARRVTGILGDYLAITTMMMLGGEYVVPLLALYVWSLLANGIRYGVNYLVITGLVELSSLFAIFLVSPFWQARAGLVAGLFFAILAVTACGAFIAGRRLSRSDSEHEQAIIRIITASLFFAYYVTLWFAADPASVDALGDSAVVLAFGLLLSLGIFISIFMFPGKSAPRRVFGILIDLIAVTYVLIASGEAGAPLVIIYLSVPLGNGLRFGVRYLYFSTALSLLCFTSVFLLSDFWNLHGPVSFGIMLLIIVLPPYMAVLVNRLNAAIESANRENAAKSQFHAKMSHELRTPLSGVIGISDLLMDSDIGKEQRELARKIQSSAHLLLGMIQSILDISKIEQGKVIVEQREFDLHAMLKNIATVFETQAQAKGLTFSKYIDPEAPFLLKGDESMLKQVLINMLGNALKFTERGGVEIRVGLEKRMQGRAIVRFEVRDTGIGIPEDKQLDIFKPFTQADSTITRRYGGTGLGMSISKQLAELMGGQIGCISKEGLGSSFWFTVALETVDAVTKPEQFVVAGALRILALADEADSRDWLAYLKQWRIECEFEDSVARLDEQVSRTDEECLRVVIVDLDKFPNAPGEVGALIARNRETARTMYILLIDADCENYRESYLRRGFDFVLKKPVVKTSLYSAIHSVFIEMGFNDKVVSLSGYYTQRSGRRLGILVAEDNKINQLVIEQILARAGHRVVLVDDGEQALDKLSESKFDMAVVDVNMPRISGIDVVKVCRFRQATRAMPIIMLTADATAETRRICEEAGADSYVTKPLDARQFLDVIASLAPTMARVELESGDAKVGRDNEVDGLVDRSFIRGLLQVGAEPEFVRGLLQTFLDDGLRQVELLEKALISRDHQLYTNTLHKLKGGAADLGGVKLVALCSRASQLKPYELGPQHRDLVLRIAAVLRDTQAALGAYLDFAAAAVRR